MHKQTELDSQAMNIKSLQKAISNQQHYISKLLEKQNKNCTKEESDSDDSIDHTNFQSSKYASIPQKQKGHRRHKCSQINITFVYTYLPICRYKRRHVFWKYEHNKLHKHHHTNKHDRWIFEIFKESKTPTIIHSQIEETSRESIHNKNTSQKTKEDHLEETTYLYFVHREEEYRLDNIK